MSTPTMRSGIREYCRPERKAAKRRIFVHESGSSPNQESAARFTTGVSGRARPT